MENKETNERQKVVADVVPTATKDENLPVNHARGFSSINLFDAKQQAAAEMLITKIMRSEKVVLSLSMTVLLSLCGHKI